jgi:hypothetical protein
VVVLSWPSCAAPGHVVRGFRSDSRSARFCTVEREKIRLATIVQALITATTTAVTGGGTYRGSKTAMPADTTSVRMLMAKASVTIAASENETLTTTRKPRRRRGQPREEARHDDAPLVCGVMNSSFTDRRAASEVGGSSSRAVFTGAREQDRHLRGGGLVGIECGELRGEGKDTRVDVGPQKVLRARRDNARRKTPSHSGMPNRLGDNWRSCLPDSGPCVHESAIRVRPQVSGDAESISAPYRRDTDSALISAPEAIRSRMANAQSPMVLVTSARLSTFRKEQLAKRGRRMTPMNDPYEDPTKGRTVGDDVADDLTQGRDVGEDTFDDPTQGTGVEPAPAEDPTQGREVGEVHYDDPTQGREVGSDPSENPTQAR